MKILTFILFLICNITYAQNSVDIKITSINKNNIEIILYPKNYEYSILSNVQFTLKYDNNIQLGIPNEFITSSNKFTHFNKYEIFAGFGFEPININEIKIIIPKSGDGKIEISDDEIIKDLSINGQYYVSIGGQDVTGKILLSTPNKSNIKIFHDGKQLLIQRDNKYYNQLGQEVIPNQYNLQFMGYK